MGRGSSLIWSCLQVTGGGSTDQATSASNTDNEAWAQASGNAAASRRATLEPALLAGQLLPSGSAAAHDGSCPWEAGSGSGLEQPSTNPLEMAGQEAAALGAQAAARQAAVVGQLRAQSAEPWDSAWNLVPFQVT